MKMADGHVMVHFRRGFSGALLLITAIAFAGCGTPYAREWRHQLWHAPNDAARDTPQIAVIETHDLTFQLVCIELRQVNDPSNRLFIIAVSCRNKTDYAYPLEWNPIQVINDTPSVVQPLPLEHVMYKLYGGRMRQRAQIARLDEALVDSGDSSAESIAEAIINVYRAAEHNAIVTELHAKEALPHEFYYKRFVPTSLPAGVSTHWIEYFPASTDTVMAMLEGDKFEHAVTFLRPTPAPAPVKPEDSKDSGSAVGLVAVTIFLIPFVVFVLGQS